MNTIFPVAVMLSSAMVVAGCGGGSGTSLIPSAAGTSSPTAALNGEQTKTSQQVLTDAKSALLAAPSVHVAGTEKDKGQTVTFDFVFQGQDSSGTVVSGVITFQEVKVGGQSFIKAPAAFWTKLAGAAASKFANKWIAVPGTVLGSDSLTVQSLAAHLVPAGTSLEAAPVRTTVNGKLAVVLTATDSSAVVIANTGKPYPLSLTPAAGASGELTFTDYGKAQTIKAPAGAMTAQQAAKAPGTP